MRYPENGSLWKDRYDRSEERWIKEQVKPDLTSWGFNTIGWAQEVIIRTQTIHRHSRAWTHEAYQWADMPYCHLLPFTEAHQWEVETRLPDVFSEDFEQWCDTVAKEHCAQMAEDPNLIGYFYCDCPTYVHTRPNNPTEPWFDPTRLESAEGRDELARMTERYYKVTHDAVRRYDPNHLILGDRYEGKALLPDEILLAASPCVDVLSYQYFSEPNQIADDFHRWGELTGKPVLLADACAPEAGRITLSGNDGDSDCGGRLRRVARLWGVSAKSNERCRIPRGRRDAYGYCGARYRGESGDVGLDGEGKGVGLPGRSL